MAGLRVDGIIQCRLTEFSALTASHDVNLCFMNDANCEFSSHATLFNAIKLNCLIFKIVPVGSRIIFEIIYADNVKMVRMIG